MEKNNSLGQLQKAFHLAFNDPTRHELFTSYLVDVPGLNSFERFTIYRNSIIENFIKAMLLTYPVVQKLVGEAFFRSLVKEYIFAEPSLSPNLDDYGKAFADFIAIHSRCASLPYLCDVARLEWAIEKANNAENITAFDAATFAEKVMQQGENLVLHLPPQSTLISSRYPLLQIWDLCQSIEDNQQVVDLDQGGCHVFVWRKGWKIELTRCSDDEVQVLKLIQAGLTLGGILASIQESISPDEIMIGLAKKRIFRS